MAEIFSVELGDQFWNVKTATTLAVVKIWFEFSLAEHRWETSVTWDLKHPVRGWDQFSGKARDFVKILQDGGFERVNKAEESSSDGATTAQSSPPFHDTKKKQWEDAFRQNASKYGLSPSDLGRKISLGPGKRWNFMIVGAKPQNWKMPILVQGKRGGVYKITAEKAKAGLV